MVDDERRFTLPPGHDEALLDEIEPQLHRAGREARRRVRPPDRRRARRVPQRRRRPVRATTAPTCTRVRRSSRARCSSTCSAASGSRRSPSCTSGSRRILQRGVADVACGQGYSTIAIARAYPRRRSTGIDLDEASIAAAQENLAGSGVEDRVTFHNRDAADAGLQGQYDFVYMHESLHDMSYPVDVLRALPRPAQLRAGCLVVADERVADTFTGAGDDVERLCYGFSVLHCLPVGMVGEGAAGTGTVMRADTVRRYARGGGVRRLRGAADRERLLPLLPARRRSVPTKIAVVGTIGLRQDDRRAPARGDARPSVRRARRAALGPELDCLPTGRVPRAGRGRDLRRCLDRRRQLHRPAGRPRARAGGPRRLARSCLCG